MVGKSIDNYGTVILVDDVFLVVAGGEYDGTACCDSCPDEWRYSDIFIINDGGVDTTERDIGCFLSHSKVVVRCIVVFLVLKVA